MTDKTLLVALRDVYGVRRAYPANETAELFAELLGLKTLDPRHLRLIQRLGFAVAVKTLELDLKSLDQATDS